MARWSGAQDPAHDLESGTMGATVSVLTCSRWYLLSRMTGGSVTLVFAPVRGVLVGRG